MIFPVIAAIAAAGAVWSLFASGSAILTRMAPEWKAKLGPAKLAMVQLIAQEFAEAGLSERAQAAAVANAWAESGLNPAIDTGDGGRSVGLFQLHSGGAGHGMSVKDRQDPLINIRTILEREVLAKRGAAFRAADAAGKDCGVLAAIFSRDIERPKLNHEAARAAIARSMFPGL